MSWEYPDSILYVQNNFFRNVYVEGYNFLKYVYVVSVPLTKFISVWLYHQIYFENSLKLNPSCLN